MNRRQRFAGALNSATLVRITVPRLADYPRELPAWGLFVVGYSKSLSVTLLRVDTRQDTMLRIGCEMNRNAS